MAACARDPAMSWAGHTTVKADGGVDRFHDGIRSGGETATPHCVRGLGHVEKVLSCAS